jgi:hypothetical protein
MFTFHISFVNQHICGISKFKYGIGITIQLQQIVVAYFHTRMNMQNAWDWKHEFKRTIEYTNRVSHGWWSYRIQTETVAVDFICHFYFLF